MKNEKSDAGNGASIEGDVHTNGGDFIGRDKNTTIVVRNLTIIVGGDRTASLPKFTDQSFRKIEEFSAEYEFRNKSILCIGDSSYVVQKSIARQSQGNFILQAYSASDQVMQENVGILRLAYHSKEGTAAQYLQHAIERAQGIRKAADSPNSHLAPVRKLFPYKGDLWIVSQWTTGLSWASHYPNNGRLPDSAGIQQLITRVIDLCAGLISLHKYQINHGAVSEETIIINKGKGTVLIEPAFAGKPVLDIFLKSHFDAQRDLCALGEVLYRTLTHEQPGQGQVGTFNLAVSPALDRIISQILDGSIRRAIDLKNELFRIKSNL